MPRVRLTTAFVADVEAQVQWMDGRFSEEQIAQLQAGLHEAAELLGRFPAAGALDDQSGLRQLRKLILRRLPFVIWYRSAVGRRGDVWLLRLFHVRQDRVRGRRRR